MSKTSKNPADFVTEGEGFADIVLTRAHDFEGAKRATLRMREPTVADIEARQDEPEATREITTFANLCECAPADIRKLPLRDYMRLQAAFSGFTT